MSMGMFSILPMLKGWRYNQEALVLNTALEKEKPIIKEYRGLGWCTGITGAATDTEIFIHVQTRSGKGTALITLMKLKTGSFATGPWGLPVFGASRFLFPSRSSTAGYCEFSLYNGIFEGSTMPFFDKSLVTTELLNSSTQDIANLYFAITTIEITNITQFVKSLRAVEGNRNMTVDLSQLEYGNQ